MQKAAFLFQPNNNKTYKLTATRDLGGIGGMLITSDNQRI
jgi:hypothetical protein